MVIKSEPARLDTPFTYTGKSPIVIEKSEPVELEEEEKSPIVTKTNFPKQLLAKPVEKPEAKLELGLLIEAMLLEEMRKAGGKNLQTEQFALLLTPKVKASEDPMGHHKWDLSRSRVLKLMRSLEKQGLVVITKSATSGKFHYLFNLV